MDKARLEKYRQRLAQEQSDLTALLSRTEEAGRFADGPSPEDMAEKAANSYTKEFLFHQSDSERTQLNLVQKALERLREGEFGLCQDCGGPIDRKRLDAVPWAPFCRSCQEKAESSLRNDLQ